jgi:hypothetical protein
MENSQARLRCLDVAVCQCHYFLAKSECYDIYLTWPLNMSEPWIHILLECAYFREGDKIIDLQSPDMSSNKVSQTRRGDGNGFPRLLQIALASS